MLGSVACALALLLQEGDSSSTGSEAEVEVVEVPSPLAPAEQPLPGGGRLRFRAVVRGNVLADFEHELIGLYDRLGPSLVEVQFLFSEDTEEQHSLVTSGVVLDNFGLVVVPVAFTEEQRAVLLDRITVSRIDGNEFSAELLAWDKDFGISLIKAEQLRGLAPKFWNGTWMQEGSVVVSMGNGFGLRSSMHLGLLTGRGRSIEKAFGLLQVTNPVNLADHGGLLANRRGQVIGILMTSLAEQAILRAQKESAEESKAHWLAEAERAEGVSFAIPVELVFRAFSEYFPNVGVPRVMGVMVNSEIRIVEDEGQEPSHVWQLRLTGVEAGSPADLAGLCTDDILVQLNGVPTSTLQDLGRALHEAPTATTAVVLRGDQLLEFPLEFED